jgi:thymidylate kinase
MSKFIIIEGTDNTGKDTQQNLIIEKLNNLIFHKVHYSSLPFKNDVDKHTSYSKQMYTDMFRMMNECKDKDINIIFNRSHLGESVYSPLYRGYSGDYVFDIEKEYVNKLRENLYLITLTNDPQIIMSRDDGKSFYGNEEEVKAEVDGFNRAHRLSKIKNKLLINIGTMSAEDVSKIIIDFLSHENTITGDPHQLELFENV